MSLQLIIGPMFAGKTTYIQNTIRRLDALGLECVAYKPGIDNRYGDDSFIYNHDKVKVSAVCVPSLLAEISTDDYKKAKSVIIEEGQFFHDLYDFVLHAVETDRKNVIVAGLDGDRYRRPFGQILELIPIADTITKLTSFCKICKDCTVGLFTYGSTTSKETVHVGGADTYMPLCRKHYVELAGSYAIPQLP